MAVNQSWMACVSVTAPASRPSYVVDEPEEEFYVMSAGSPFIHGFDMLSVNLRHIRICGDVQGTGHIFVRNDAKFLSRG